MNKIYANSINRNGFIIKPTKLFNDWVKYVFPRTVELGKLPFSTFYLIPAVETLNDMEQWLEKNYDRVFKYMLDEVKEKEDSPANRDLAMFKQWFTIEWCDLIVDLGKEAIVKSKDE